MVAAVTAVFRTLCSFPFRFVVFRGITPCQTARGSRPDIALFSLPNTWDFQAEARWRSGSVAAFNARGLGFESRPCRKKATAIKKATVGRSFEEIEK